MVLNAIDSRRVSTGTMWNDPQTVEYEPGVDFAEVLDRSSELDKISSSGQGFSVQTVTLPTDYHEYIN